MSYVYRPPHRPTDRGRGFKPRPLHHDTAATVEHAIIRDALATATGNQDITHASWTTTPSAVVVLVGLATTEGTAASDAGWTCFLYDFDNPACASSYSADGLTTTVSSRTSSVANIVLAEDATAGADATGTVSAISGGIRINWTTAPSSAWRCVVLAFGGSSVSAKSGEVVLPDVQDQVTNVTHAADTPTELLFVVSNRQGGSSSSTHAYQSFGVWAAGSNQKAIGGQDQNGVTTTALYREMSTNYAHTMATSSTDFDAEAAQRSDGFSLTVRNQANGTEVKYLSLNFSKETGQGLNLAIGNYDNPTSTGNQTTSGLGFDPTLVLIGMSGLAAQDTETLDDTAGPICIGIMDADEEGCVSVSSEDGVTTSVTESLVSNKVMDFNVLNAGSTRSTANFVSFGTGEFTVNHTAVDTGSTQRGFYLAIDSTAPSGADTIDPNGIASTVAFGTPKLTLDVTPTGIASTAAFGTATIVLTVHATGIASTAAFGTPQLDLDIAPAGIASTLAFGTALLTLDVTPTGIASTAAFGTPDVGLGIAPAGIASTAAFGTPQLNLDIAPTGIASTVAFGTALLTLEITPAGIAPTAAFGSHTLTETQNILPTGIASTVAFGTPQLDQTIFPAGIASTTAFGTAVLTLDITPTGISSTAAFGTPQLDQTVFPVGIASTTAFGTPQLDLTIFPNGIASTVAIPDTHDVSTAAAATIEPAGIASTVAFGTAALTLDISPTGIGSATALGAPSIGFVLFPVGIDNENDATEYGNPTLGLVIHPDGILAGDQDAPPPQPTIDLFIHLDDYPWVISTAVGTPDVGPHLHPTGIASTVALGTPGIRLHLHPVGFQNQATFGGHFLNGISVTGIASTFVLPNTHRVTGPAPPVVTPTPELAVEIMLQKERIHNRLVNLGTVGTFYPVTIDSSTDLITIDETTKLVPSKVGVTETISFWQRAKYFKRWLADERAGWTWLMRLQFTQRVASEVFEEELSARSILIPPDDTFGLRGVVVRLVDAAYTEPPEQAPSRGSQVDLTFEATLMRR